MSAETINILLKEHQVQAESWEMGDFIADLHLWAERYIFEFKLKCSVPALMIDNIGQRRYGHYRPGRNGFGLQDEIAINETHLHSEYWQIIGTLFHELLHAEQQQVGKPGKGNYHNKEFRERAKSFGLMIDEWGHTVYAPAPTLFFTILQKYGVNTPKLPELEVDPRQLGKSKLKLWICGCQPAVRARVAIADFQARCLKCGQIFVKID